jgi:hypothetical protein
MSQPSPFPSLAVRTSIALALVAPALAARAADAGGHGYSETRTLSPVEQVLGGSRSYEFVASGLGTIDASSFLCATVTFQAMQNGALPGVEISHAGRTAVLLSPGAFDVTGNGASGPLHLQSGTDPFSIFADPVAVPGEISGYAVRDFVSETDLRAFFDGVDANGLWTVTVRNASATKWANLSAVGLVIDATAVPAPAAGALLALAGLRPARRRRGAARQAVRSSTTR